jgi:hypothetical protein
MKKRILTLIIAAGLMISANLAAQTSNTKTDPGTTTTQTIQNQSAPQAGPNFTDKNKDGICDNQPGKGRRNRNFTDANNDGTCDNFAAGSANQKGRNFVDANNDGVCDNFSKGGSGRGYGKGRGCCSGNGHRHGNRFNQK